MVVTPVEDPKEQERLLKLAEEQGRNKQPTSAPPPLQPTESIPTNVTSFGEPVTDADEVKRLLDIAKKQGGEKGPTLKWPEWSTKPIVPEWLEKIIGPVTGPAEIAMNAVTGLPGFIAGGIAKGIGAVSGPGSMEKELFGIPSLTLENIKKKAEAIAWEPKGKTAKEMANVLSKPWQLAEEYGPKVADTITEATGSPTLGTVAGTAVQGAPDIAMGMLGLKSAKATKPYASAIKEKVIKTGSEIADIALEKYYNDLRSIEKLTEKAEKTGKKIPENLDTLDAVSRYRSTAARATDMIENGVRNLTPDGKWELRSEGLGKILGDYEEAAKKVNPGKDAKALANDLHEYLVATRAIEDLQRPSPLAKTKAEMAKNIVTDQQLAEAKQMLSRLEKEYGSLDFFKDHAEKIYRFKNEALAQLVDSGYWSPEQYAAATELNKHHVRFEDIIDTIDEGVPPKGISRKGEFPKKIRGWEDRSLTKLENVIENTIEDTIRITERADRATVFKTVYEHSNIPDLGIEKIPEADVKMARRQGKLIVEGRIEGKPVYLAVPRSLYIAFDSLNGGTAKLFSQMSYLDLPAKTLKWGVTSNPVYWIWNWMRDQPTAFINLSWKEAKFKPFMDPFTTAAHYIKRPDLLSEFIQAGGAQSTFVELSRSKLKAIAEELTSSKNPFSKKLKLLASPQEISQAFETITKLSVYEKALERGMDPRKAATIARRSTTDWSIRPASTVLRNFQDLNAFFRANINATIRQIEALAERPLETSTKAFIVGSIPSLLLKIWAEKVNDPEYNEIPRRYKDIMWILPIKIGGTFPMFPKAPGLQTLFASATDRFLDFIKEKDPDAFSGLMQTVIDNLNPGGGDIEGVMIPTFLKPHVENLVNYKFFTETPIVSPKFEEMLPFMQGEKWTPDVIKKVAEYFNVSPAKLSNVISSYGGSMAREGVLVLDSISKKLKIIPEEKMSPVEPRDLPLLGRFFARRPLTSPQSVTDFYRYYKETKAVNRTVNELIKRGQIDKAIRVRNSYEGMYELYPNLEKIENVISNFHTTRDQIINSNLPLDKKEEAVRNADQAALFWAKLGLSIAKGKNLFQESEPLFWKKEQLNKRESVFPFHGTMGQGGTNVPFNPGTQR